MTGASLSGTHERRPGGSRPAGTPSRPPRLAIALLAALALAAIPASSARTQRAADPPVAIEIAAKPFAGFDHGNPSRRRFGQLEFRGGLVLTSSFKQFGGVS